VSDIPSSADPHLEVPRQKSGKYAMYVFWVMFGISFLNYLDRNVLTGAAATVAMDLGFTNDGIGYIASAFLVVYTLGTVPLGIWADRAKRKNVVAICVAIWSIATALTALATNFITLFLSRMILGIGEAGYFPAGTALMSDYFSRSKRSRIMSWWSVGQLVGILFGYVIGGELAGLFPGSWRLAFVFTGIPGLFLAFLAWKLREPRRNEADEEEVALYPYSSGSRGPIDIQYIGAAWHVTAHQNPGGIDRHADICLLRAGSQCRFPADLSPAKGHLRANIGKCGPLLRSGDCAGGPGRYGDRRLYG